jgi:hypothetical protein
MPCGWNSLYAFDLNRVLTCTGRGAYGEECKESDRTLKNFTPSMKPPRGPAETGSPLLRSDRLLRRMERTDKPRGMLIRMLELSIAISPSLWLSGSSSLVRFEKLGTVEINLERFRRSY